MPVTGECPDLLPHGWIVKKTSDKTPEQIAMKKGDPTGMQIKTVEQQQAEQAAADAASHNVTEKGSLIQTKSEPEHVHHEAPVQSAFMALTEDVNVPTAAPNPVKNALNNRLNKLFAQLDVSTSRYLDEQALVAKALGVQKNPLMTNPWRAKDVETGDASLIETSEPVALPDLHLDANDIG